MNYYKFTYQGRNYGGCNSYQNHQLIIPSLGSEKEAVKQLEKTVKLNNQESSWPHQILEILDCEQVTQAQYDAENKAWELSQQKQARMKELNAILKSQ